jgi:hypothetical protein
MNKRLFSMIKPLTAQNVESGARRSFRIGEVIFAEYPLRQANGYLEFEQDNVLFRAGAQDFRGSTQLAGSAAETP